MSERQVETTMNYDTKPGTGSGQSWIYSSLVQMGHSITNLASNLGKYTGLYTLLMSDREILSWTNTEEDNKRLIDLWSKPESAGIAFIALHALTQKDDETKISQIGISAWHPDRFDFINSIYVQVEQGTIPNSSLLPQKTAGQFIFGETEVIDESDIGPWLQCTFKALQGPQCGACLIGFDIRRILQQVRPYWSVPPNVLILDTQSAHGFQTESRGNPLSFRQTLKGANGFQLDEAQFGNAGNFAQSVLKSFQNQVRKTEDTINSRKAAVDIYRTYDGYHF